ncbi:hypothetical protein [Tropicibacter sp. S64]|uniref:hypothetical protein n=1 Tax=Tropicibacter sp. S64 TaxID=3415122 RepID=UPI003C7DC207
MTDAAHVAKTAKTYAGYAKAAADKLEGWQKEAAKLSEAGKTLNDFQTVMQGLTWAGKLSAGLGAVSFGVAAIASFLPVPTTEDKIYSAVQALQRQVSDLKTDMETLFDELEEKVYQAVIEWLLQSDHITHIKTATDILESIAARRADPALGGLTSVEDDLFNINPDALRYALTAIETALTTQEHKKNLLWQTYDLSYGDPREMIRVGGNYQSLAMAAVSAFGACKVIHARRAAEAAGEPFGEAEAAAVIAEAAGYESVPTDPAGQLAHIVDTVRQQVNRCYDRREREAVVKHYFDTKLKAKHRKALTNCQGYAETIVKDLHTQFPYLNFSAIVTWGWRGDTRRGWHVGGAEYGVFSYGRMKPEADSGSDPEDRRNLIVYFAPRTEAGDPPLHVLPTLPEPSPARKTALGLISMAANYPKHGGLFRQWKKIGMTGSVTTLIKSLYPGYMGRMPKHWGGDLVWACYTDDTFGTFADDGKKTGDERAANALLAVMGVASQNPIGFVMKYDVTYLRKRPPELECRYYQVIGIWDDAH